MPKKSIALLLWSALFVLDLHRRDVDTVCTGQMKVKKLKRIGFFLQQNNDY